MNHIGRINQKAIDNEFYRNVLATGPHLQVVIMSIPEGGEIGEETHPDNDQVLYLVEGRGQVILNGAAEPFGKGDVVLVPAGTKHNFTASEGEPLKIITVYAPPHHPDGLIHKTKAEADREGN
jgi:mannose-6-phosphate isomerase-like protein (cupin superfamily)